MKRKRRLQWIAWLMALCMILTGMPLSELRVRASGNEAKETEQIEESESAIIGETQSGQASSVEKSGDGSYQFRVCYDNKGYDNEGAPKAWVKVNDVLVENDADNEFAVNQELVFELHPPVFDEPEIAFVSIHVGDEFFSSDQSEVDADHLIELEYVNDEYYFSYTPKRSDWFYVSVMWSDYDHLSSKNGEFLMNTTSFGGGTISVDAQPLRFARQKINGITYERRIYSTDMFENGGVIKVSFHPDMGKCLEYAGVWTGNRGQLYSASIPDQSDPVVTYILEEGSGFVDVDGLYSFLITETPYDNFCSITAKFYDGQGWKGNFYVAYDEGINSSTGTADAWVKANGFLLSSGMTVEYESSRELVFRLHPPASKAGNTPAVWLQTYDEIYSSCSEYVDADHLITLAKDGDDYVFSYTPRNNRFYGLEVYWSEYDVFSAREDEILVETRSYTGGSISLDREPLRSISSQDGAWTQKKSTYPSDMFVDGGTLRVALAPEDGYHLTSVEIWDGNGWIATYHTFFQHGRESYILSNNSGFIFEVGVYYFEIASPPQGETLRISARFEQDNLEDNKYLVYYAKMTETYNGYLQSSVKVNGNDVNSGVNTYGFIVGQSLEFELYPPESRVSETPVVMIRLDNGEAYSSRPYEVRPEYVIVPTRVGNTYTFTYTPSTEDGLEVTVHWCDYDLIQLGAHEFMIQTAYTGLGGISVSREGLHSRIEPGENSTGVQRFYSEDMFDDGSELEIIFEPAGGYYLESVRLSGRGYGGQTYLTHEPGEVETDYEYILTEGSGFIYKDGTYRFIVSEVPPLYGSWTLYANYKNLSTGIQVNTGGAAQVEYAVAGGQQYISLEPNENSVLEIPRAEFNNASSITLHFTPNDELIQLYGVIVRYSWDGKYYEKYLHFDSENTYTLRSINGIWPEYSIRLITWSCPLDGEYMFKKYGDADWEITLGDDLEFNQAYSYDMDDMCGNGIIIDFCSEELYWLELFINDDCCYSGQIIPPGFYNTLRPTQDDQRILFVIYQSKEVYDYYHLEPTASNEHVIAYTEFGLAGDPPGVGGYVTFNDDLNIVDQAIWNNRSKVLVRDATGFDMTIHPAEGYTYRVRWQGEDVTREVMGNGNVLHRDFYMPVHSIEITYLKKTKATMYSATAAFDGKLGIVYYLFIPEWLKYDPNAYVTFERDGEITTKAIADTLSKPAADDGTYRFAYYMPAAYYRDAVTLRIFSGDEAPVPIEGMTGRDYTETGITYSLKRYVDYQLQNGDERTRKLAKAMDDYCTAAQIYFDYKNENYVVSDDIESVTQSQLGAFRSQRAGNLPTSVSSFSLSASFTSDNTLKIGLTFIGKKPKNLKYYIDGKETTLRGTKSTGYYLAVRNIAAVDLDRTYTFMITDGTTEHTQTIACSIYTYANAFAFQTNDMNLRALVRALYLYGEAANDYFGRN